MNQQHQGEDMTTEDEARKAIEEQLGPVRGDWIVSGAVSMLARIAALVRKGETVEAAAWAERLEFLRDPVGPVPAVSGERLGAWMLSGKGDIVRVMREGVMARLVPSVLLSIEEIGQTSTAVLAPADAREVALQLLRFAANASAADRPERSLTDAELRTVVSLVQLKDPEMAARLHSQLFERRGG